jgi:peptidoglycan/xylan/chitin deacetylase (PgdA/CDA1 family)
VLSYHRVADERPGYRDIAVAPRTLRAHIDFLRRRGYSFLSLSEYEEYLSGSRALERDSVLLTFDDGYRDNYSAAFPVLREFGIPAAVFLCTGPIDEDRLLWWDRVAAAVRSLRAAGTRAVVEAGDLPPTAVDTLRRGLAGDDRQASLAIGDLVDSLKSLSAEARERALAALERPAPPSNGGGLMLTWDMVREMRSGGIGFGAHSVTHPAFSDLSAEEARAEISGSVSAIERELGERVTAFAYPYGKEDFIDTSTAQWLRECGIRWAFTTENGWNGPETDPMALRRNGMRDVPAFVLAARMSGIFEHPMLSRLRSRVERRPSR